MDKTFPLDIVCIATPAWDGDYNKSTVQLMKHLGTTHRVLYVDYPYTIKDVLGNRLRRVGISVKRIIGFDRRIRKMETPGSGQLYVYTPPPTLPINWISNTRLYYFLLKVNNWIVMTGIRRALSTLGIKKPIVVNALNPFFGLYYLHKLSPSKIVYYCYDEISAAPWLSKHGESAERQFAQRADAIVTSSQALREKKLTYGKPCFLVKNGVDFEMFHKYFAGESKAVSKVVGYVGSLDERLNYELLEFIIRESPEWEFRFVGRVVAVQAADVLRKYKNVKLLPPVDYKEVPKQISQFDVGIIPFVRNEFTRYIYPLKVNEYLAVGKPVVMTNFAPLDEFAEVAHICENSDSFLDAIATALADTDDDHRHQRAQVAQQNSWEKRTQELLDILYNRPFKI